jgi:hypothetical protein
MSDGQCVGVERAAGRGTIYDRLLTASEIQNDMNTPIATVP